MQFDQILEKLVHDAELLELLLPRLSDSVKGSLCEAVAIELYHTFERTRSMEYLDRAIVTSEQAMAYTPDDRPDVAGRLLNNLALALQLRFEQTGSMEDLNGATRASEKALASMADDDVDRATVLNNAGIVQRAGLSGLDR